MRRLFFLLKKIFIKNPRLSIFFICSSSSLTYYYRKNNIFNHFRKYNPHESIFYKLKEKQMNENKSNFSENSNAIHVMEFDENEINLSEMTEHESIEIISESDFKSLDTNLTK